MEGPKVEYVGPFESHAVVVNGWSVPYLEATPLPGGRIALSLDRRYELELSLKEAEVIVPFLADAIGVASGFASHPTGPKPSPALTGPRRMHSL